MKKLRKKISVFNVIVFLILLFYSISLIMLLGWGVLTSFKQTGRSFSKNVLGLPTKWMFSNYPYVFENMSVSVSNKSGLLVSVGMGEQCFNTIVYCVLSSICASFVPCWTAYLVSKYKYKFSKILYSVALIAMSLPIIGAYPSELQLLDKLGVYNTFFTIILQRSGYLGLYFFVFVACFNSISNDFYEAATLDGAGETQVFFTIMFPMVLKTYLTVILLIFVANWNDYQYPLLYMPSKPTLAYGLFILGNNPKNGLSYPPMYMTGCCILMLPILLLFIIFKEKLMGNISMGGLKE